MTHTTLRVPTATRRWRNVELLRRRGESITSACVLPPVSRFPMSRVGCTSPGGKQHTAQTERRLAALRLENESVAVRRKQQQQQHARRYTHATNRSKKCDGVNGGAAVVIAVSVTGRAAARRRQQPPRASRELSRLRTAVSHGEANKRKKRT